MSTSHAAAAKHEESFPVFGGRMHYIDGYTPVSLVAPHSSLERTITWVGMGLVLTGLAGVGMLVFGLATRPNLGGQENPMLYIILGLILTIVLFAGGALAIHKGRADYRHYRKETGRLH